MLPALSVIVLLNIFCAVFVNSAEMFNCNNLSFLQKMWESAIRAVYFLSGKNEKLSFKSRKSI